MLSLLKKQTNKTNVLNTRCSFIFVWNQRRIQPLLFSFGLPVLYHLAVSARGTRCRCSLVFIVLFMMPASKRARTSTCTLTHLLTHLLIYSFTHSLTHSLDHSLIHSVTHSPTLSVTHSLNQSITQPLTHPHAHSLTHSVSYSLTHSRSLPHSLTLPLTHKYTYIHIHLFTHRNIYFSVRIMKKMYSFYDVVFIIVRNQLMIALLLFGSEFQVMCVC